MDLLYLHILGIPKDETLSGVYIVDGTVLYASTKVSEDRYRLYNLINHNINELLESSNNLGHLDTVVANKHFQIIEQSGHYEKGVKVVNYKTTGIINKNIKRPNTERKEISRYVSTRRKKLF